MVCKAGEIRSDRIQDSKLLYLIRDIKQSNTVKALVAKSRDLAFYPVFNW